MSNQVQQVLSNQIRLPISCQVKGVIHSHRPRDIVWRERVSPSVEVINSFKEFRSNAFSQFSASIRSNSEITTKPTVRLGKPGDGLRMAPKDNVPYSFHFVANVTHVGSITMYSYILYV